MRLALGYLRLSLGIVLNSGLLRNCRVFWFAFCAALTGAIVMMMMILHQMRHGRQDNHATNHVRCTKMRKAGKSRRHIEAKQSETKYL
jgi:hypothetical protein